MTVTRHLVLVAGPSGSGKSRLVAHPNVLGFRLDDFYRDADTPDLPRALGIVDWDDVRSWDLDAACDALTALLDEGHAAMPVYDIGLSRRIGEQTMVAEDGAVIMAEGIFALDLLPALRERGVEVDAIYLDRPRWLTFVLRLERDLREHRKTTSVLLRRGVALLRADPGLRRRAMAAGFRPLSMRAAVAMLDRLPTRTGNDDPDTDD